MLELLEEMFNDVSDMSGAWWPFLFLRPASHERMSSSRVLLLAALYGVPSGLLANIVLRFDPAGPVLPPAAFPLGMAVALFLFYRLTFAVCWNRRAARLTVSRARSAFFRGKEEIRGEEDN